MIPSLFGKKTVASVLGAFHKVMDDLKAVVVEHETEAAKHAQQIVESQAAHEAAINEAALAREVHGKLESLISPVVSDIGHGLEDLREMADAKTSRAFGAAVLVANNTGTVQ